MNIQNFMKKIIILNKYSNNHLFHLKTTRKTFNLLGSITQKSFSKKEKTEYTFLNIKQDIDFNKEYYTITTDDDELPTPPKFRLVNSFDSDSTSSEISSSDSSSNSSSSNSDKSSSESGTSSSESSSGDNSSYENSNSSSESSSGSSSDSRSGSNSDSRSGSSSDSSSGSNSSSSESD